MIKGVQHLISPPPPPSGVLVMVSASMSVSVLIHAGKGVVVKGVTLTHTVSYQPDEKVFIKQQPGSNSHFTTEDNRVDREPTAR